MTSTKEERRAKANMFLHTLNGNTNITTWKRVKVLPKGMNYLPKERLLLNTVIMRIDRGADVPINYLFDMEEMENKYRDQLMLAKLMN